MITIISQRQGLQPSVREVWARQRLKWTVGTESSTFPAHWSGPVQNSHRTTKTPHIRLMPGPPSTSALQLLSRITAYYRQTTWSPGMAVHETASGDKKVGDQSPAAPHFKKTAPEKRASRGSRSEGRRVTGRAGPRPIWPRRRCGKRQAGRLDTVASTWGARGRLLRGRTRDTQCISSGVAALQPRGVHLNRRADPAAILSFSCGQNSAIQLHDIDEISVHYIVKSESSIWKEPYLSRKTQIRKDCGALSLKLTFKLAAQSWHW